MCFGPSVNPAAGAAYGGAAGMLGASGGNAGGFGGFGMPQNGGPQGFQPRGFGGPFGFGGGFGSSPWLAFLMNHFSSLGSPQMGAPQIGNAPPLATPGGPTLAASQPDAARQENAAPPMGMPYGAPAIARSSDPVQAPPALPEIAMPPAAPTNVMPGSFSSPGTSGPSAGGAGATMPFASPRGAFGGFANLFGT